MKTTRPLITGAMLLIGMYSHAQLHAGEVPDGATAYPAGVDLTLSGSFISDSAAVEFDCDDFMDAQAFLYQNAPQIDAPNYALLHFIDADVEVCMDLATGSAQRPRYHGFGEALDCSGAFAWQSAEDFVLGDVGGFLTTGPWEVDSQYIAYRRGNTVGWMLLSFQLNAPTIDLRVHELLSLCQGPLSVSMETTAPLTIHAEPGNRLRVESPVPLRQIELLDASGRLLARHGGQVRNFIAPATSGPVLLSITHADGQRTMHRIFLR